MHAPARARVLHCFRRVFTRSARARPRRLGGCGGSSEHRNAHPLTRRLYGWLRDRSPADKRLVFEAVSQRAGVKCTSAKQEEAYDAVRVFVERYGYVPAAGERDSWRKGLPRNQPKPPSASFLRGAFGD